MKVREERIEKKGGEERVSTIEELAAVGLAGCDFESHDMALFCLVSRLDRTRGGNGKRTGGGGGGDGTCASLSSLMGMPIVEVMAAFAERGEFVGVRCGGFRDRAGKLESLEFWRLVKRDVGVASCGGGMVSPGPGVVNSMHGSGSGKHPCLADAIHQGQMNGIGAAHLQATTRHDGLFLK